MNEKIEKLAKLIRYYILTSTTEAGSGHPSSSLSSTDLMAVLMYGGDFRFDLENPDYLNNDRLIFSKGHASPLFYALWAVAGQNPHPDPFPEGEGARIKRVILPEELLTLRKFGSRFEGHPTMEFPFTEVPTGSLGQGLGVGVGMALNAKLDKLDYRTFVLLGDSEMAEGSVWEAFELASYYQLNNLVAILDVNRLGQRGETMHGADASAYQKKAEAFGWETVVVDGHNIDEIEKTLTLSLNPSPNGGGKGGGKPLMIIAKTLKGKGVSFMEDKDGWHGKALSREELDKALEELGEVDKEIIGEVTMPAKAENPKSKIQNPKQIPNLKFTNYKPEEKIATRKAYGNALVNLVQNNPNIIVLDAETSNSTYADMVKKISPEKFIECFIAEQNMVSMALGFSRRGKIPFVSTFSAFFTRAFDQIRMSQFANSNIKFIGSHAGVSIGEDGASQMGLEELAMFRTLLNSVVLYPSDAVSTEKLVLEAVKHFGNVYIQTTRKETPILYSEKRMENREEDKIYHEFKIGGSCVLKSSDKDVATVVGAGITVYEALRAYEELQKENINIRVIDLYSIKPIDTATLEKAARETKIIITVEDSYPEGGVGEAVKSAISTQCSVHSLAVRKMPRSGKPEELLAYEEIDRDAIIKEVKKLISK